MVDHTKLHLSNEALFRYRVVSMVQAYVLLGMEKDEAVEKAAAHMYLDHRGNQRSVGKRSVYRYLEAFEQSGPSGLEWKPRKKYEGLSMALRDEVATFLLDECRKDGEASIPELIERARATGTLRPDEVLSRVTVWRMLKRQGITIARAPAQHHDKRRFELPHRMNVVLADFVHFRAGPSRKRRLAIYFIDDYSRYCLGVAVTTKGEAVAVFMASLYQVVCRFGLMDALYLDRGPAFKADDTAQVLASLDVALILGEAAYPEGHGKIERFNKSARGRQLRSLAGDPDVDPCPDALTQRLTYDAFEIYNHRPHEGIHGQTPYDRFFGDTRILKPVQSDEWLRQRFIITEKRRVSNDNVIPISGTHYEMPCGYAGTKVAIERRLLEDNHLYFDHQGDLIRLHPVDPHLNARTPRAKGAAQPPPSNKPPRKSASSIRYERTYGSVLDQDGGFPDT